MRYGHASVHYLLTLLVNFRMKKGETITNFGLRMKQLITRINYSSMASVLFDSHDSSAVGDTDAGARAGDLSTPPAALCESLDQ